MAKKFSFSFPIAYPINDVHAALVSPELWQRRVEGAENVTMTTESTQPGTLKIAVTQHIGGDSLPAIARKALRGDLTIVRVDNWGALNGGSAEAEFTADSTGLTSHTSGRVVIQAEGETTTYTVEGETDVKARVIGGALEKGIVQMISNLAKSECADTEKWIASKI
ncbi:DUF2505 domain-containing protein [Hoyosella rhizosphaerae]|uniref:DUF2505 domain-containing protein n=1 Tax=Hoyosella rhizosphaerae TaxID=1755582 RepID=A0A916U3Q2_9ACTN|nr:DUF2505 domain-containing protein [Hoyosella rhizosphaerae]MBN4926833.1 DUF2505 domain-containing protein [Hoyosella rhizosphaerae]GGC56157.1 hypothetical protein GCM10011410_05720 [Hoyosella rhizosphaerae]